MHSQHVLLAIELDERFLLVGELDVSVVIPSLLVGGEGVGHLS